MSAWLQNIGSYASDLVDLTFRQFAYQPTEWLGAWTLFYWSWWIAWAPFVGMFIARISRGRTIREFVLGVMAVPSLFIFFWMTVFGDTAIHGVLDGRMDAVMAMVNENMPLTLFVLLEQLPFSMVTSVAAIVLIVTFFVTSSDSGSLVVDMITSGGADDPPVWQRIFWAVTQGVVAAVLLVAGGLGALQTAALTSGLPLAVVMLFICLGLYTALSREHFERTRYLGPALPVARARRHWRHRLEALVRHHDRAAVQRFIEATARPAFESVAMELRTHAVDALLDEAEDQLVLRVLDGEAVVFEYAITARSYRTPAFAFVASGSVDRRSRHWLAEVWCSATGERYDVLGLERESLIDDLLASYSRWIGGSTEALRGELLGPD
jgi:choline/glycine/proline betaine transport protein